MFPGCGKRSRYKCHYHYKSHSKGYRQEEETSFVKGNTRQFIEQWLACKRYEQCYGKSCSGLCSKGTSDEIKHLTY